MTKPGSFAIIGGGIGGLTLAIAMQRKGYPVTVYENASLMKPLGAGLSLAANAIKAFSEIGIDKDILPIGKVLKRVSIKDQHGSILNQTDSLKLSAKYGTNNFTVHRADLHNVLTNLLKEDTVQLGKGCIDFKQESSGTTLYFSDGTSAFADYVIASDGIHSIFRQRFLPSSHPRYAGYTCWRAVIDNVATGFNFKETSETWGPGCRFGIVPLSEERLYWFACINAKANDPRMKNFQIADLLRYFRYFHSPIPEILGRTRNDQLIWGDIIDFEPLEHFAFGNIVLVGDAAHATTPNLGQGACMAIEDAVVLTNCLEQYKSPQEAFKIFEEKRIRRTTKIVNTSWRMGKVAQLENLFLIGLRNLAIRLTPKSVAEKQMKFLYEVSFR